MEKNQKWYLFEDMTDQCYKTLNNGNVITECWYGAFETLLEIIAEEREKNPGCYKELLEIDQATEFKYSVVGWVDDYFKELVLIEDYDRIYRDGIRLLEAFEWQNQSATQIRLRVVNALERLGMHDTADKYNEEWNGQNSDDMSAVLAALILGKQDRGNQ